MVWYLNVGPKAGLKKIMFMVQNVLYLNGLPSHMTIWLQTSILSGTQVFGIQMVIVVESSGNVERTNRVAMNDQDGIQIIDTLSSFQIVGYSRNLDIELLGILMVIRGLVI